jgi:TRAP-type C4-dicarboxylate transport system substrate-binding protein
MMTAEKPINNTDDLAGLTMMSRDETVIDLFSDYGAIMQPIGNLDGYEALSKGIADGGVWNWEGPALFGWWDAFDPGYYIDIGGVVRSGGGSNCIANLDFWNSLPADLQEQFKEITWYWTSMYFAAWIDYSALAFKREAAKKGIQYIVWSDAEKNKLNSRKEELIQNWIDRMGDVYGLGAEAEELIAIYHKAAQEYVPPAHIPVPWHIGKDQAEKDKMKMEWEEVYGEGSTWGAGYKAYPNQISTTEVKGGVPEAWPEGTRVQPVNPLAE